MAGTTLGTAYIQIVPSADGIAGSIRGIMAGEGEAAGASVGSKIGMFAKKAIVAAGIGAAVKASLMRVGNCSSLILAALKPSITVPRIRSEAMPGRQPQRASQ